MAVLGLFAVRLSKSALLLSSRVAGVVLINSCSAPLARSETSGHVPALANCYQKFSSELTGFKIDM